MLHQSQTAEDGSSPISTLSEQSYCDVAQRTQETLRKLESLQAQLNQDADSPATVSACQPQPLHYVLPPGFLLSVVIPVYNEQSTICRVLGSVLSLPLPLEVLIVDDGSTDGTRHLLQQLQEQPPQLRVIFQECNRGKGSALRRGFAAARGSVVIVQDADLEYDPRDIPALIEPLAKDEADVVYGSRFLERRPSGSSLVHRLGNRLLTISSNLTTGLKLTDMETCYKAFRRELIDRIELEQDGFGFEVELTAKLAQQGVRLVERPISYDARGWDEGKKIGWRDAIHALRCILRYRK